MAAKSIKPSSKNTLAKLVSGTNSLAEIQTSPDKFGQSHHLASI
jgi:hypothetical protein